jgi:Domain of unknown function (DUF4124)
MSKDEHIDLFPWILGGLIIAIAIPTVMALTRSASEIAPVTTMAPVSADSRSVGVQATPLLDTVAPVKSKLANQIWQCVNNGQKTFSDSPCGADASVHQLSEINRMDSTAGANATAYPTWPSSSSAATPPNQDSPDADVGSSANQFIVIGEREWREKRNRMHDHDHDHDRDHEHRAGPAHN